TSAQMGVVVGRGSILVLRLTRLASRARRPSILQVSQSRLLPGFTEAARSWGGNSGSIGKLIPTGLLRLTLICLHLNSNHQKPRTIRPHSHFVMAASRLAQARSPLKAKFVTLERFAQDSGFCLGITSCSMALVAWLGVNSRKRPADHST